MTILNELKSLAAKVVGVDPEEVNALTIAKAIRWLNDNLPESSGGAIAETDPTVPDWAKQAEKPTYTAAEIGALPATAVIPSGAQLLAGELAEAITTLEEDAELTEVVQAVNAVLAALKTRGVTQ